MDCYGSETKKISQIIRSAKENQAHSYAQVLTGHPMYSSGGGYNGYPSMGGIDGQQQPGQQVLTAMAYQPPETLTPPPSMQTGGPVMNPSSGSASSLGPSGLSITNQKHPNYCINPGNEKLYQQAILKQRQYRDTYENMLKTFGGLTSQKKNYIRLKRFNDKERFKQLFEHGRVIENMAEKFWVPEYVSNIETRTLFVHSEPGRQANMQGTLNTFIPTAPSSALLTWGTTENWAQGWGLPIAKDVKGQVSRAGNTKNTFVLGVKLKYARNTIDYPIGVNIEYLPIGSKQHIPFPQASHIYANNSFHFIIPRNYEANTDELIYKSSYRINNEYGENYPHITGDPETINTDYDISFNSCAAKLDHPIVKRAIDNLAFYPNWNKSSNGKEQMFFQMASSNDGISSQILIPREIWEFCAREIQQLAVESLNAVDLSTLRFSFTVLKNVPKVSTEKATSTTFVSDQLNSISAFDGQVDMQVKFYYCFRDIKETYVLENLVEEYIVGQKSSLKKKKKKKKDNKHALEESSSEEEGGEHHRDEEEEEDDDDDDDGDKNSSDASSRS